MVAMALHVAQQQLQLLAAWLARKGDQVQLAQYLLFGRDAAVFRNLLITGLSLRSRPENALIGGTLRWRGAGEQVGAYAPQPSAFAVPAGGVSADLHLGYGQARRRGGEAVPAPSLAGYLAPLATAMKRHAATDDACRLE